MNLCFFPIPAYKTVLRITVTITCCLWLSWTASSENVPLSDRGKAADANKNGLIERSEAGGPLAANFDEIDCDKNGGLDGAEIPVSYTHLTLPTKSIV